MYRNIEDGTEIPEYGTLIRSRKVTIAAVIAAIVALTVLLSASSPAPIVGQAMEASQLDMSIEHDKVVKESDVGLDHPIHMDDDLKDAHRFFHISDTHIDPFFDPTQTMQDNVCHSCQFSTKVYGENVFCPSSLPETFGGEAHLITEGFAFGRYSCNPPQKLLHSLLTHLKAQDPDPKFIVFTGDIAPHGFPGDGDKVTKESKLSDLCPTKMLIFEQNIRMLKDAFPNTKFAFTMGNNDHFPKNTFWQPYITALGDMFLKEGFIDKRSHESFVKTGSHSVDVDNIRLLCIDLTLFSPGGETSFVESHELKGLSDDEAERLKFPVRTKTIAWVEQELQEASTSGMAVYIVGHQPLTTKKGKDELDIEGLHFGRLKNLLAMYSKTIKMAFFGHRNLAGLSEVLGPLGNPLIPSLTGPGVSPRGKNQPSYNTIFVDRKTSVVLEFEQWSFNLMDENEIAKKESANYLGTWKQNTHDMYSWRAISGEKEFTANSLSRVLASIPYSSKAFFAIEVWKRAGFIGDETPMNYKCKGLYDTNEGMMRCLFRNQDLQCWSDGWLA